MDAVKDKAAVSIENVIFLSFKIQAKWGKVRIEINIKTPFGLVFKPGESGNEFPSKVVYFGESFDLIKFAISTIVYHNNLVLMPLRRFVGIRPDESIRTG